MRPVITHDVVVTVQVKEPGDDVAVYPEMVPPWALPAVQETVSWPLPVAAVTAVGADGVVAGTMAPEAADVGPVPLAFTSLTVTV